MHRNISYGIVPVLREEPNVGCQDGRGYTEFHPQYTAGLGDGIAAS